MNQSTKIYKDDIHLKEISLYHFCRTIQKLKIGKRKCKNLIEICRSNTDEDTFFENLKKSWDKYDDYIEPIRHHADRLIFQASLILIREVLPFIREKYLCHLPPDSMTVEEILPGIHPLSIEADEMGLLPLNACKLQVMKSIFETEKPYNFAKRVLTDEKSAEVICQLEGSGVSLSPLMLVAMMSIDQINKAKGGAVYEQLVKKIISDELAIPLEKIQSGVKDTPASGIKSVEFDCFFEIDGTTIGISVKKTMRERWRMNHGDRNGSKADRWMLVTLGTDLSENTMIECIEKGIKIFVADEIYDASEYLQRDGVYPVSKLTADTLRCIAKSG